VSRPDPAARPAGRDDTAQPPDGTAEPPDGTAEPLRRRYTPDDLAVLTPDEAARFIPGGRGDPRADITLAWELLYRLEPGLYDRLARAERLHPGVLRWLPRGLGRIVEVGAGTGRLTLDLLDRAEEIVAVEPVAPFREILERKIAATGRAGRARVAAGFFDDLPVDSGAADLVVTCSALTPASGHGGAAGLAEMERACRRGGCVAIIWPNHLDWLAAHGYQHASFAGPMTVDFASHREAVELAEIFYPHAVGEIRRRGCRSVPWEVLGVNPPRDVAFRVLA